MHLTLHESLVTRSLAELEECYAFWIGGEPPLGRDHLVESLLEAMQEEDRVRLRVRALAPRVVEVLGAALADRTYSLGPSLFRPNGSGQPDYELDAALSTLVRHGFLGLRRDGNGNLAPEFVYIVPKELGDVVSRTVGELARGAEAVRSLRDFAQGVPVREIRLRGGPLSGLTGRSSRDEILSAVAEPDSVAARIESLPDARLRELVGRAIADCGGILPRSQFERFRPEGLAWDSVRLRDDLEERLLGTCARIFLEEFGINLMEEAILVFAEIVRGHFLEVEFDPGKIDRVAESGVNLLSDLTSLVSALRGTSCQITRENRLFRTFSRRFADRMVTRPERFLSSDEILEYLEDVLLDLGLVRITPDRRVAVTDSARNFDELPLFEKLRRVLGAVLFRPESGESSFHLESLRRLYLDTLARLAPGRWYDPMAVPFVARNRYLANLVRLDIRTKYENVCRYSGPTMGGEPARMAWSLYEFTRRRLFPLGLVDLANRGERVIGVRLNELGAVVLGAASPEDSDEAMTPLVVNPDFEVLLFPEGRNYTLVHRLDQFANRTKTDHIHHYRLTEESVRRAVVAGMSGREILETLEASSRTPIPQNVAFSIREWSGRIRFVRIARGRFLVADDRETIDRILEAPALTAMITERVDERTIRIRERPEHPNVVRELAAIGIYFH